MTDAGRVAVLILSLLFAALLFQRALRSPGALGPEVAASSCAVAIERAGEGVACLGEEEARRAGIFAGDRVGAAGDRVGVTGDVAPGDGAGGPGLRLVKIGRMAPSRLELFAVPLDVNAAPVEELASLPGIGPKLAERIAAARPFANIQDLGTVKGVGARRMEALRPRLRITAPPPPAAPGEAGRGI